MPFDIWYLKSGVTLERLRVRFRPGALLPPPSHGISPSTLSCSQKAQIHVLNNKCVKYLNYNLMTFIFLWNRNKIKLMSVYFWFPKRVGIEVLVWMDKYWAQLDWRWLVHDPRDENRTQSLQPVELPHPLCHHRLVILFYLFYYSYILLALDSKTRILYCSGPFQMFP